ncbi:MAG: ATP-grasp domain-containing protein [Marinilabiliaceae bacterium]|jgi:carbamoyl-phosphate synthase large subunit|nr:ATP-grasp domain-containing protein [Marinilabiliaceae bacterium]
MSKRKITIALTGLNNTDNPGPGIPVIRGIRDSEDFDVRIIGLAYESLEPGIYMHDIVDLTYRIPYPSEGSDILLARILEINKKENINLLIPNFDAELVAFMKAEKQLADAGIATFLPTRAQYEEREKSNLPAYGKKYDVKVPFSKGYTSLADLEKLKDDFEYPLVVKGKFYDAYIANNRDQAAAYFMKISARWGLPVIIQEFVRGTEVNVVALGDGRGNTIAAVPMRKQYITDKGKAWAGVTLDDRKMLDLTNKLISESRWRGGMELELIRSEKNELFLIEINPRIPAWVYLAVGAGQNIPEALVRLALGDDVKPFTSYKTGKMFIRYSWDMITDMSEFEKLSMNDQL